MTDDALFVFKNIDLIRLDEDPIICSSWYMSAWSNQRILLLLQKLLFQYWRDSDRLGQYYLFHLFLAMAARRYSEDWEAIPVFNNQSPHTLQFEMDGYFTTERWEQIKRMSPLHKLNHHIIIHNISGTFYEYVLLKYGQKMD